MNFSNAKLRNSNNFKKAKRGQKERRNQGGKYKTWGQILTRPKAPHNTTQYLLKTTSYNCLQEPLNLSGSMIGIVNITEIEQTEETQREINGITNYYY